ncbi:hypothetical protein F5X96DRAFT_644099 [Biscogniauxia mediterranea]|nr:hypothetical protein F5X96DRAFT_644099 [Biscogniauxia mediterranea]
MQGLPYARMAHNTGRHHTHNTRCLLSDLSLSLSLSLSPRLCHFHDKSWVQPPPLELSSLRPTSLHITCGRQQWGEK